jgi:uncharacterized membrane protein
MSQDAARRRPFVRTPWRGRAIGFGSAALAALLVLVLAPGWLKNFDRAVAAYDVGAIALVAVLWTFGMHRHPGDTQSRAAVEDPGRNIVLAVVLFSVIVGLASAVVILGRGPHVASLNEKIVVYVLGLVAVVVGWVVIQTFFLFRYAHLFYFDDDDDNEADRGLAFPGTKDPNDYDFAYFSFVIGMTYQVSDVQITDPGIRRVVLMHALISFAYNTAIVALVINLLSGLFH